MNGQELLDWFAEKHSMRLASVYLAGFIHGQIACESRVEIFNTRLSIPSELSVATLIPLVKLVAKEQPDYLGLDVATFMHKVFERSFSKAASIGTIS